MTTVHDDMEHMEEDMEEDDRNYNYDEDGRCQKTCIP